MMPPTVNSTAETVMIRPTVFSCLLMGLMAIMVPEIGALWIFKGLMESNPPNAMDMFLIVMFLLPSVMTSLFLIHLLSFTLELSGDGLSVRSLLMPRRGIRRGEAALKRMLYHGDSARPVQIDLYPQPHRRRIRLRVGIFGEEDARKIGAFVDTIPTDTAKRPSHDIALLIGIALTLAALLIKHLGLLDS